MFNTDEIQLLNWAFAKSHWFQEWFLDELRVPIHIWYYYIDILKDIKLLPIKGIQEKLAQIGNPLHLLPTLSELKAAKVFATREFEVEILSDNDKRFKKPPDLHIKRKKKSIIS